MEQLSKSVLSNDFCNDRNLHHDYSSDRVSLVMSAPAYYTVLLVMSVPAHCRKYVSHDFVPVKINSDGRSAVTQSYEEFLLFVPFR